MVKIYITITLLVLSSCFTMRYCPDKATFLSEFESFAAHVQMDHLDFNQTEWGSIDKQFDDFIKECYPKFKQDMLLQEKLAFWKGTLIYGYYREKMTGKKTESFKAHEKKMIDELEDLGTEARIEFEDFIKREFGDELLNLMNQLQDELKSVSEELKNWINNS